MLGVPGAGFEPAISGDLLSGFRIRAWIMSYAHIPWSVPGAIGQAVLPRHPHANLLRLKDSRPPERGRRDVSAEGRIIRSARPADLDVYDSRFMSWRATGEIRSRGPRLFVEYTKAVLWSAAPLTRLSYRGPSPHRFATTFNLWSCEFALAAYFRRGLALVRLH